MRILKSFVMVLFLFVIAGSALSQSFYSSKGIGLRHYFVSGQAIGMGGVGLAVVGPNTVNFLNPAPLAELSLTYISGNFLAESSDLKSSSQDAVIANTNVAGVQFVIPLKRNRVVFAIGLMPYSFIEYSFVSSERSEENKSFTESIAGSGGVNSAFLSFSVKPFNRLYLGVTGIFHFGIIKNRWQVDFDNGQLLDTDDELTQNFSSLNLTFGFLYKVRPNWRIGGVITPSVTLDANKAIRLQNALRLTDLGDSDIEIPLAFGLGTSVNLSARVLLAADYYSQKWSQGNLQSDGYVNDSRRIGIGFQFSGLTSPNTSYLNRVDYQVGFYYNDLGLEVPIGEKVTEYFGTVGLGLPIKWSYARINLALEAGRRGSMSRNPFRENVIRFSASVTIGERWFYRPQR